MGKYGNGGLGDQVGEVKTLLKRVTRNSREETNKPLAFGEVSDPVAQLVEL